MNLIRLPIILAFIFSTLHVAAAQPVTGKAVPPLTIEENGELTYDGEDFSYIPWTSSAHEGKLQIIQYFGANLGDRDIFAPFTDRVQATFEPGSVHVTTVLNLDAALWGTGGMVKSELKKNKKKHRGATIVVDKEGIGVDEWALGKAGTGLMIINADGIVELFSTGALSEDELGPALKLIGDKIAQ